MPKHIVTGLDIGTSKVAIVIARPSDDDKDSLKILGCAQAECGGSSKGVVTNLSALSEALTSASEHAQKQAQCRINTAFVNIAGTQVTAELARGRSNILDKEKEISRRDLNNAAVNIRNTTLPYDRQAIHMAPQCYAVDGQRNIKNPLGLFGTILEADYYIVSAPVSLALNLTKAVNMAGLETEGIALTGMATAASALTQQERQSGVMLLDIGDSLTEAAVIEGGILRYSDILPFGTEDIAGAVADELNLARDSARKILRIHGRIHRLTDTEIQEDLLIQDADSARNIPKKQLYEVIESKLKEILSKARHNLTGSGRFKLLESGIVLSGGISMMDGAAEFTESVLGMKVRVASLKGIKGLLTEDMDSSYMTAVGLVKWGLTERKKHFFKGPRPSNPFMRTIHSAKEFIAEYF